ncbi:hypothetical protein RHGRI_023152 [Rhododendron griersonianum]|uniref:Uncharacterized protein n=1 Tax=Rhododendron griersonianum TaxID=479676 RepID=A0AAV6J269_9ERIC|nr:hypothetical protein RHGRI_023152 [Rhododendron griersonianum]
MLKCVAVALIPILSRALEHVAKFLRRNFSHSSLYRKYLEEPCVWVESNTTMLNILSSQAEIGLGFLLVLSLFSLVAAKHNTNVHVLAAVLQWPMFEVSVNVPIWLYFLMNCCERLLLKLMYNVPVTAVYHQSVWAKIGRTVDPLVHRYAPFLNKPISAVRRWWLR